MTRLAPRRWVKRYATAVACRTAAAHHHWLADLGAPVPTLYTPGEHHLEFEHIVGRHAQPRDLPRLAGLLGWLHRTAYTTDLHRARLDRPHTTSTGLRIPDFLSSRRTAITTLLIRKSSRGRASGSTGSALVCRGAGTGEAVVRPRARG